MDQFLGKHKIPQFTQDGSCSEARKEIAVLQIGEEENKTVFAYNMIVYVGKKKPPRILAKSLMNTLARSAHKNQSSFVYWQCTIGTRN